jgi:CheY-like chemotaxis protein
VDEPMRVLVVDDSADVLFLIQLELEWLGHKVLVAQDGVSGMEIARREKPDVIVSDIKMPGMDGYELIRQIRSLPELARTPAIALTGFGMKRDVERALSGGFDAHIVKPSDIDQLSDLIRDLTRKH